MSTAALTLTLPPSLARELNEASSEFLVEIFHRGLREWRIEKALESYRAGEMSFGAAAQRAGLSQSELARHAYSRGMEPPASAQTLAEELS